MDARIMGSVEFIVLAHHFLPLVADLRCTVT
jgi:hypothetical protein